MENDEDRAVLPKNQGRCLLLCSLISLVCEQWAWLEHSALSIFVVDTHPVQRTIIWNDQNSMFFANVCHSDVLISLSGEKVTLLLNHFILNWKTQMPGPWKALERLNMKLSFSMPWQCFECCSFASKRKCLTHCQFCSPTTSTMPKNFRKYFWSVLEWFDAFENRKCTWYFFPSELCKNPEILSGNVNGTNLVCCVVHYCMLHSFFFFKVKSYGRADQCNYEVRLAAQL